MINRCDKNRHDFICQHIERQEEIETKRSNLIYAYLSFGKHLVKISMSDVNGVCIHAILGVLLTSLPQGISTCKGVAFFVWEAINPDFHFAFSLISHSSLQ